MTAYAPRSSLNYAARSSCKFYNSCGCRYGKDCRFVHAPHEHSVNGIILEELHVIKSTINTSHHMFMQHCNAMQIEIDRMKMEMEMKKEEMQQQQEQQLCIGTIQTNDAALHQQPSQCMNCNAASKQQQQQQRQLDELQSEIKRLKNELKEEKKKKKKELKHVAMQTNAATLNQQQQQQQLQQIKALQIENKKVKNELIDIKKKKSKPPQCKQCKAASKTQQQLKHQTKLLREQCGKYEDELKQQQQRHQEMQHEIDTTIASKQELISQVAAIKKEKEEMKEKLNVFVMKEMQCVAVQTDGNGTESAQQQQQQQNGDDLEVKRSVELPSNVVPQQQQLSQQQQQKQKQQQPRTWTQKLYRIKLKYAAKHGPTACCKGCNNSCAEWMCMDCDTFMCGDDNCRPCVCEQDIVKVLRNCDNCKEIGSVAYVCKKCNMFICGKCKDSQHQDCQRLDCVAVYAKKSD